jgi:DUSAM domain-containing protein
MTEENEVDWDPIRTLARRVLERGDTLDLSDATRALLHTGAREVAISPAEAEDAMRSVSTATTLLREIQRRMDDGNDRLSEASFRAYRLRDTGDFNAARRLLEDVLRVEVVPLYRQVAETVLENLAKLEAVATSGLVAVDVNPWAQVRVLARRIQEGCSLELHDELCAFLRKTAPSVAISEAETDAALQSAEGAEALLGKMLERIDEGQSRIRQALSRMMDLREAGDREGALQQLRDVLAVEVVPLYRQMAQENLDRYDEPLPDG